MKSPFFQLSISLEGLQNCNIHRMNRMNDSPLVVKQMFYLDLGRPSSLSECCWTKFTIPEEGSGREVFEL